MILALESATPRGTVALVSGGAVRADLTDKGEIEFRTFTHTDLDPAFGARGLATILVEEALRAARDADLRIASHCSMVTQYIAKHPEYQQ